MESVKSTNQAFAFAPAPESEPVPFPKMEAQIPPHTQDDDLTREMPPLEQLIRAGHLFRYHPNPIPQSSQNTRQPNFAPEPAYLDRAGVPVDHIHLVSLGILGNGHIMMLEKNNLMIAAVMTRWLEK
jgi:hypothetical protein